MGTCRVEKSGNSIVRAWPCCGTRGRQGPMRRPRVRAAVASLLLPPTEQAGGPLPQLETVCPHLDFISLLKCSWPSPPAGRVDPSPTSMRCLCSRDVGSSHFSPWPSSQCVPGAIGQVNPRAGNRPTIDMEGEKIVALLNTEALVNPGY